MIAILVGGCQGQISEPGANAPAGPIPTEPRADEIATCLDPDAPQFDEKPIRVLSRREYNNTIRDLLGDDSEPLEIDPAGSTSGFDNNAAVLSVDARLVEHYLDVAEAVAARAMENSDALLGCEAGANERDCALTFITTFGLRAFRRPLATDEVDSLLALYDQTRELGDFAGAMELVLQGILISPQFLYHIEEGEPVDDQVAELTDYEIASRLSYFLWNTMPDEVLLDAAAAGELGTAAQIRAQATRMLEDWRARSAVANFHLQWLELDRLWQTTKDAELFPDFDDELRSDMAEETILFLERLVWEGGDLAAMYESSETMLNARLADHYGMTGVSGEEFRPVESIDGQRNGLLTQASILSINAKNNRTSPVHRGLFVRERLLCDPLPPPPNSVPPLPEVDANATVQERLAQHREDPACAGCHVRLDPIGFAFEHYDAVGRYRTEDEYGRPIDATGELAHAPGIEGEIDGAGDLAAAFAHSEMVSECMALQWFRYAMARSERAEDACALDAINAEFASSGYRLRDLLFLIVESDSFRYRAVVEAEACE